ncbi:DegT/DnrJ/EryC1/StrS family aminotransferase [uncultured Paludibaculum sp.]|uniref:DegT/DnrJ/EryC1/StrS family aminotransferase n=1 Tax=uncultured Paludibaculum sp. TaxID=1765020 RepID=UPI002AAB685D|nr:DegT/DnrJ/EryC1/StrS family aminotransferase [uncultured Paludibaculum sp.]
MITKTAARRDNNHRPWICHISARKAFESVLKATSCVDGGVLLPAYVGWSANEGSGVFDPVAALGLSYSFYRLTDRLEIDLSSLRHALDNGHVRVVVLIHYFGHVDRFYEEAVHLARARGALVVEDEAHALLSDLQGGICGRLGDFAIYSLHKLLPLRRGGAVIVNTRAMDFFDRFEEGIQLDVPWYDFDLKVISERRVTNAVFLDELVRQTVPEVEPLWGKPRSGEVPQTYPVLVRPGTRDSLYHSMNQRGFGVVSLYHTLIEQLSAHQYGDAHQVSARILNLPVHQDISEAELEAMVGELRHQVREPHVIA